MKALLPELPSPARAELIGALLQPASGQVSQVSPTDPLTFAGAAVAILCAGIAACFVPARRAASVDPQVALRCEKALSLGIFAPDDTGTMRVAASVGKGPIYVKFTKPEKVA